MSDFEQAAINAVSQIFPHSKQTGCLFHYAQCIFRQIKKLPNLYRKFKDDEDQTKTKVKCFVALAFCPPGFPLYNYFCVLIRKFTLDAEFECMCIH